MSTKKRPGRPSKKNVAQEATSSKDGSNIGKDGDESNADWNKVVESTNVTYNPDKVRSKQVEIAKVRVKVNEAKEELEVAVAASDFIKAQEIKDKIDQISKEQTGLESELKEIREDGNTQTLSKPSSPDNSNSNSNSNFKDSVVAKFPALFEHQDDQDESFSFDDTDDEFAPPGAKKKNKKRGRPAKKVKRLKKAKPQAPTFLPESIVGKYSVLIHREDPDYEEESKESTPDQVDDLTKIDDCDENPNFALVTDFIARFGDMVGLRTVANKDLQLMLCAQGPAHLELILLHMVMLRKIKLPKIIITKKSWEKALVIFCKEARGLRQESQDLTSGGYAGLGLSGRLELLKRLMEAQFDWNDHVRTEVEDLAIEILRNEPVGRDVDGQIYWTQIDETADIRVYSEDHRFYTWGSIAQDRAELVSLVERLKEDKLYKKEIERLQTLKSKKESENDIVDAVEMMTTSIVEETSVEKEVVSFCCEVCSQKFWSRDELMGHHSLGHMFMHLQTKFSHLVDKTQCKICKFEAGTESLIWVHIGADHDKVNIVLKENGLKPIEEVSVQEKPSSLMSEPADNQGTLKQIIDDEEEVIRKLEMKITQVKYQMENSAANEESHEVAENENNATEQVPNNCADDEIKLPLKRGRSDVKEKMNKSKKKTKSKSKSSSRPNSRASKLHTEDENASDDSEEENLNNSSGLNTKPEEQTERRPKRACKDLKVAIKEAEDSFKKPIPMSRSSSSKSSRRDSLDQGDSLDPEESIENITEFLEANDVKEKLVKNEEEDDSGFESKDIKDETDEEERKSVQGTPSKRARKCKNKSYNDEDPFGEEDESEKPKVKKEKQDESGKPQMNKEKPLKKLEDSKVTDVSRSKVKDRKETKLSCKRCNEWKDESNPVYACTRCGHGWHQMCAVPPLAEKPEDTWKCPLCQHIALVEGLERTLVELDHKMEQAEERRLAALTENQNRAEQVESEEEEEEDDKEEEGRTHSPTKSPKLSIQNNSPVMIDVGRRNVGYYCELDSDEDEVIGKRKKKVAVYRPNYNELSTDEEIDSDPEPQRQMMCNCDNKGTCLFCKRMKGCTCDGAGTCRLCMSELVIDEEGVSFSETKSPVPDSEIVAIDEPPQMSTTELFLMTGQTRQADVETPPPALEYVPGRGQASGRGRGRGRAMRALRGGRPRSEHIEPESHNQVMLVDSHTLRPTGMRASLRPRGRGVQGRGGRGGLGPGVQTILYTPGVRPRAPRPDMFASGARPDTFESGVMVRGSMRPARPMGQGMRPVRQPMGQPMGQPMRGARPPMQPMQMRTARPVRPMGLHVIGRGQQPRYMGPQPRQMRPRMQMVQNQSYDQQNPDDPQPMGQQPRPMGQQPRPMRPRMQMVQNQSYGQQNPMYIQANNGLPGQVVRNKGPVGYNQQGFGPRPGRARQPVPYPSTRGRPPGPRLQPRFQVAARGRVMRAMPHRGAVGGARMRGPPRGRPVGRQRGSGRGLIAQRPQGPQIVSVHSNRLAGIMNNQYPNDGAVVVDLDDDDDDDDEILVPTLNPSYRPAPDFNIIDADEMHNYDNSGEYIEDAYEAAEQPKYFPPTNQQQVYDID